MAKEEGRRGGRAARRALRTTRVIEALPALIPQIPLVEVMNAEGEELIHDSSMKILEEVGIEFRDDEALAVWKELGADVKGECVHLPRELVMDLVSRTPSEITFHGRNPERAVVVGGDSMTFAPTYGSPFVLDFENKRRYGTIEDLNQFHKLAYMQKSMHFTGGIICEPVDVPVHKRHLHIAYSLLKWSDKPLMGATTSRERAEDSVEMAKLAFGDDFIAQNTVMTSIINCNSPLVWDSTMLDALKVYSENNQSVIVSPFVLAGANTPASSTASVAQLNAEALAGIAFGQAWHAGAPTIYGQFLAAVSMKSGAPMAGTPELGLMNLMVGQLARRYRLPWRSSGMLSGSKVTDAQAAYESIANMFPIMLSRCNLIMHSAGWLEGGLAAGFAKFMLDCEQVEMLYRFSQGPQFTDYQAAMDAVREVGPGSHYLGTDHTREHFQTAFFLPELADNGTYEQWLAEGAKDSNQRALEAAQKALDEYEEPKLDEGRNEALLEYMAKREAELPDHVT